MDTVIIKIYGPKKFKIENWSLFLPELMGRTYSQLSLTEKNSTRPYLRKYTLHPQWQDRYLPRVEVFETLTDDRKDIRYILKAEFSIPKLLYGNSLEEVTENDKDKVFSSLQSALASVNIIIEKNVIASARVSGVHFCKNILLPTTLKMREVLNELKRVDISKAVDVMSTQFKNGGRVLNIYSGTIERSFYDKISDSMRPKNKRSDKSHIDYERAVVEKYNLQDREVFRYEYRLKKMQTIKREINGVLVRDALTLVVFNDLFTPNLLKTVIVRSWNELIERPENQLSLFGTVDKLGLFLHILSEAKKQNGNGHGLNTALISYGLTTAIRDHGAKEVRGAIFDIWNNDHSERLTKKIQVTADLTKGLPYSHSIDFIDRALESFALINLTSLQNGV